MRHAETVALLAAAGFRAPREALQEQLDALVREGATPTETLAILTQLELHSRAATNLARRTKTATLGTVAPLDRFDWNYPRRIDRPVYEALLKMEFVRRGTNVLLRGPSGVGKTMLAQNLGVAALASGFSVRFTTLSQCIADLLGQESTPALARRLRRYTTPNLLVLDELGYLPSEPRAADLLYQIQSVRHGQRSTVISTNLAFKQWGAMFGEAGSVTPLVDRFTEDCVVLDIEGESWRQRKQRKG
jgi:DNA replication protein DnaC